MNEINEMKKMNRKKVKALVSMFLVALLVFLQAPGALFAAVAGTVKILVEPTMVYQRVYDFSDGLAAVVKDDKIGFIDKTGKEVIPCVYDRIDSSFSEGVVCVRKDGKWGFMDKTQTVVIPCVYDDITYFSKGIAVARKDKKYGIIDKTGSTVVPFDYQMIRENYDYDCFTVKDASDKYGIIDVKGNFVVSCVYEDIRTFNEGFISAKQDGKWGFINISGQVLIPFMYDDYSRFNEGLARVKKGDKYGYIDKNGNEAIPFIYDDTKDFNDGITRVRKDRNWSYIDKTGKEITPLPNNDLKEGLSPVEKDGKWGYINKMGTEIIPFLYDYTTDFNDGLALVKKEAKWGLIDEGNNAVLPCIYDYIQPFSEGLAITISDGKYGITERVVSDSPLPATPALTATPTSSTVLVNGKSVSFDAYNINGNNYFKLRDLAFTLNGTKKQFDVSWDGQNNTILIFKNKAYTVLGGEMTGKGTGAKTPTATSSKIMLDGKEVKFTAYNIGGSNYFKLRDIGETFNFSVDWDGQKNTIVIDTSKGYGVDGGTNEDINSGLTQNAYLKNFPTVPYFLSDFKLEPQRIKIIQDTPEIIVYFIDHTDVRNEDEFYFKDLFDNAFEEEGFKSVYYDPSESEIWYEYTIPYSTDFNIDIGVCEKGNVRVVYITNGGGAQNIDVFIATKIK